MRVPKANLIVPAGGFRQLMEAFDLEREPAKLREAYGDGEFAVLKPGRFVRCAVTGEPIALDDLRYWSVARQEAYSSPDAVMSRLKEERAGR